MAERNENFEHGTDHKFKLTRTGNGFSSCCGHNILRIDRGNDPEYSGVQYYVTEPGETEPSDSVDTHLSDIRTRLSKGHK